MELSDEQVARFEADGYLFMAELFDAAEVAVLLGEVPALFAVERKENVREKRGGAVRTNFAAHTYNDVYGKLARHPRLVAPIMRLLGGGVYVHQFKINGKAAFNGDVWQWHQDYGNWLEKDGMPEPRALNIAVFLDEVFPFNGPLMLIPRSHRHGVLESTKDTETTSFPLYTQSEETVEKLCDAGGLVAPTGKPGSMLMFDGNLVHGSSGNITPFPRKIVYLTVNACSNYIRKPTREEWLAHQDFTPIETVPDDALLEYARREKKVA